MDSKIKDMQPQKEKSLPVSFRFPFATKFYESCFMQCVFNAKSWVDALLAWSQGKHFLFALKKVFGRIRTGNSHRPQTINQIKLFSQQHFHLDNQPTFFLVCVSRTTPDSPLSFQTTTKPNITYHLDNIRCVANSQPTMTTGCMETSFSPPSLRFTTQTPKK
jgi:hypothetical protein